VPANMHLGDPREPSHNPKVAGSNPALAIRKGCNCGAFVHLGKWCGSRRLTGF
jgi:hypothetical protein